MDCFFLQYDESLDYELCGEERTVFWKSGKIWVLFLILSLGRTLDMAMN